MVTGPISKTKPPTHSNRPALSVRRLDKRRTGCRCTTTPLLRHIQLAAGIYPMTWRMRGSCSAVKSPLDLSNGRLDMAPGHRCNRLGALYPRTPMVPAAHRSEICRSVVGRSLETQRCLPPIRPPNQDLHLRNQAHRSGPSISWSARTRASIPASPMIWSGDWTHTVQGKAPSIPKHAAPYYSAIPNITTARGRHSHGKPRSSL